MERKATTNRRTGMCVCGESREHWTCRGEERAGVVLCFNPTRIIIIRAGSSSWLNDNDDNGDLMKLMGGEVSATAVAKWAERRKGGCERGEVVVLAGLTFPTFSQANGGLPFLNAAHRPHHPFWLVGCCCRHCTYNKQASSHSQLTGSIKSTKKVPGQADAGCRLAAKPMAPPPVVQTFGRTNQTHNNHWAPSEDWMAPHPSNVWLAAWAKR